MANPVKTGQETDTPEQSGDQNVSTQRSVDVLPPVDIREDQNGIVLTADLPGVASDSLAVNVDDDVISIEGDIHVNLSGDLRARFAEMRGTRYARRFTLSQELDAECIEADMRDGVLTLKIPKKASMQPRRVPVTSA